MAAIRSASASGLRYLVYAEQSADVELWRWQRGSGVRDTSIAVARLRQVKVSPGGESGWWTDRPAIVTLVFEGDGEQLTLWVPGNQRGTLELSWLLDKGIRRRKRRTDDDANPDQTAR